MIIEFSVENYRSIKELQTLNLSAANIVSRDKEIDSRNTIRIEDKFCLIKSKAIYGANAGGKSNILKALVAFISIVDQSVKDENILNNRIEPYILSTDTLDKPTFFQLTFVINGVQYRYGFQANDTEILSEWLFGSPGKREVPFFTREGKDVKVNSSQFKEGAKFINLYNEGENDIVRSNSLFLTAVKSFNGEISKSIIEYITKIIVVSGLSDKRMYNFASKWIEEDEGKEEITELLKIADIGIEQIRKIVFTKEDMPEDAPAEIVDQIEKGKKNFIIVTEHKKFDSQLEEVDSIELSLPLHESQGSIKMFEQGPFILQALKQGRPMFIDEFDARFHPLLTRRLVELFNSKNNTNTQFVFITHDVNLLDAKLLRRDQIAFVEKDKYGATNMYDLVDFKGVRNDASLQKDYISGKYGAIPFIGDFDSIIG